MYLQTSQSSQLYHQDTATQAHKGTSMAVLLVVAGRGAPSVPITGVWVYNVVTTHPLGGTR